MKRREALATVGVAISGVSGCVGRAMEATGLSDDTMPRRRVSIADADTVPAEYGVALDVEAMTPTVTPEHTADLRFKLSNVSDETKTVYTGGRPVFGKIENEENTPRLALIGPSDTATISTKEKGGNPCWMARDIIRWDIMHISELGQGDQEMLRVKVLDVESANKCFPSGAYRYSQGYRFERSGPDAFEWGFTLQVKEE